MANKPRSKSTQFKFDGPHPVDIAVGNRLRNRRILMGMSQERLGDELGITFQQVQKYEKGANRVSASRLSDISAILEVSPGYFFEDIVGPGAKPGARRARKSESSPLSGTDPLNKRETLELVRAYYRIPDANVRQEIASLIRALGK